MNRNSGMGPLLKGCGEVEIELISFKDWLMHCPSRSRCIFPRANPQKSTYQEPVSLLKRSPSTALLQIQRHADQWCDLQFNVSRAWPSHGHGARVKCLPCRGCQKHTCQLGVQVCIRELSFLGWKQMKLQMSFRPERNEYSMWPGWRQRKRRDRSVVNKTKMQLLRSFFSCFLLFLILPCGLNWLVTH